MSQDYIKEKAIKGHSKAKTLEAMKISLEQMENSICKIKCSDGGYGTGFFINIINIHNWNSLPLKALITNNHVLKENDILPGKKIFFSLYNDKHKLEILIDESRKIYTSEKYDISIIELKQNDGIKADAFLEIDRKVWKDNPIEIFKKMSIYLLHYPNGIEAKLSDGTIQNIEEDNFTIHHLCDSDSGSSGGPLISLDSFKVIGIHKGASQKGNWNLGSLIKEPIEEFYNNDKNQKGNIEENKDKSELKKIEYKNNILDKNNIDKDIIDDEITILYELNQQKNKISNELIKKVKDKWGETISENKIFGETFVKNNKNRCKIIINGKEKKLCSYFDNENLNLINGKLEIKLKRISKIKYSSFMFCGCISLISLPHISKWNTGNVNNMKSMFFLCHKLKNISNISISQKKMKKL